MLDIITFDRITQRLAVDTPICTTMEGAAVVLHFLAEDRRETNALFHAPMLASVLRSCGSTEGLFTGEGVIVCFLKRYGQSTAVPQFCWLLGGKTGSASSAV